MESLGCLAHAIDRFNRTIGQSVAWLAVFMIVVQFVVVLFRYVFGYGSIFMQESIIYMHGLLFMLGAGYTLLVGGHVRVDIFYREAAPRKKARVDLFGVFAFLIPVCIAILYYSWPYVAQSWATGEGSKETSGIPLVYLLKTAIPVFCVLIIMQGLSMAIHSVRVLAGYDDSPFHHDHEEL